MKKKILLALVGFSFIGNSLLIAPPHKIEASSGYTISYTAPAIYPVSPSNGGWITLDSISTITLSQPFNGLPDGMGVSMEARKHGTSTWERSNFGFFDTGESSMAMYPGFYDFACYDLRGRIIWYEGSTLYQSNEYSNIVPVCLQNFSTGEVAQEPTTSQPIIPTTPTAPTVTYAPISSVAAPTAFDGSTSTFTELSSADASAYSGLTIESSAYGKIMFNDTVDLSTQETADKFAVLDQYVNISEGSISIGLPNEMPEFVGKSVSLSFYNVKYGDLTLAGGPKVDLNGVEYLVEEYTYENEVLTVIIPELTAGSHFDINPGLTVEDQEKTEFETDRKEYTIKGSLLVLDSELFISLNGEQVNNEDVTIDENGNFSTSVELKEGENDIYVSVTTPGGNKESYSAKASFTTNEKDEETFLKANAPIIIGAAVGLIVLSGAAAGVVLHKKGFKILRRQGGSAKI